jgi:hypothetical protein
VLTLGCHFSIGLRVRRQPLVFGSIRLLGAVDCPTNNPTNETAMTYRRNNTTGRNVVHIETARPNELPVLAAVAQPRTEALPRPPYAPGSAEAREAGRRGGKRKAGTTALAAGLGLARTFADETFEPYRRAAENFARLHVGRLASVAGECGPAPASIVWSAGLQLAASRWAFEVKGDAALGSKLANDSRQNLLAAHELCAREAESRRANLVHDRSRWLRPKAEEPRS